MVVPILDWNQLSASQKHECLQRPARQFAESLRKGVAALIQDVRLHGDEAIRRLTQRFDKVEIDQLQVAPDEFAKAEAIVSDAAKAAIRTAIQNIEAFHRRQLPQAFDLEVSPGVRCMRQSRPIERVGLYVPGGTAPLPSTVIMLAVPARLAACPQKVLCTPPNQDGEVNPYILVAAKLAGIDLVYRVGGVQAIAAMAYGSESIPKVEKIFGPGNSWVTEAKLQVAQDPAGAAYDLPAGPSEVLVIADQSAKAEFIAADLLSQAEHGTDSQAILLTDSSELAASCKVQLIKQAESLSRKELIQTSMQNCRIILCRDVEQCFAVANLYAPEHLIVHLEAAENWIPHIQNAGSVFLGPWSPESVGDYASGTNHVLPTYGYARSYSGLSIESFMKHISFQQLTAEGLLQLGPIVEQLSDIEGLDAHRNAVSIRLKSIRGDFS